MNLSFCLRQFCLRLKLLRLCNSDGLRCRRLILFILYLSLSLRHRPLGDATGHAEAKDQVEAAVRGRAEAAGLRHFFLHRVLEVVIDRLLDDWCVVGSLNEVVDPLLPSFLHFSIFFGDGELAHAIHLVEASPQPQVLPDCGLVPLSELGVPELGTQGLYDCGQRSEDASHPMERMGGIAVIRRKDGRGDDRRERHAEADHPAREFVVRGRQVFVRHNADFDAASPLVQLHPLLERLF
mmetsp:Transcript_11870/g.34757  ORF Transcript_11870/g.34757 Transcript_11870/m.34757 type:complete len:238 (-) Transcript_11870:77-790(-)